MCFHGAGLFSSCITRYTKPTPYDPPQFLLRPDGSQVSVQTLAPIRGIKYDMTARQVPAITQMDVRVDSSIQEQIQIPDDVLQVSFNQKISKMRGLPNMQNITKPIWFVTRSGLRSEVYTQSNKSKTAA